MNNSREYNWYRKSLVESNQFCLYCGRFLGKGSEITSNREHLIGREFVPSGSFRDKDSFNFIFRACERDNNEKSDYERHISSITLFNSLGHNCDKEIKELAIRKATKDYHPGKKGIKIVEAQERMMINYPGQNFSMSFSLIGPPQPDNKYVLHLAFMQMQGFFSLITTPRPYEKSNLIFLSSEYFSFIGCWPRTDWGNIVLTSLSEITLTWNCYANIDTANGYYKAIIRCDPYTKLWFWAFEWNKSYRIAGLIGDKKIAKSFVDKIPKENWKILSQEGTKIVRVKSEKTLDLAADKLFIGEIE